MTPISKQAVVTALLLGATISAATYSERRRPDGLAFPLETIDAHLGGWSSIDDPPLSDKILGALKPTSYLSRQYNKAGQQLSLFISFYDQQRSGESMHSPKHCLPGSGWEIWKIESATVPVAGKPVEINQYSIQHIGQRAVVYYWYQSRDRIISSEYLGKVLLIRDALFSGHTSGSIVRIIVEDKPEVRESALAFAGLVIPEVQRVFGR
jgi:EpsI family protein